MREGDHTIAQFVITVSHKKAVWKDTSNQFMKENYSNSVLLICKKTFGCPGGLRKLIMSVNDFKKAIWIRKL